MGGKKFTPPDPNSPEFTVCLVNMMKYYFGVCALLICIVITIPSAVALVVVSNTIDEQNVMVAMYVVMGLSLTTVMLLGCISIVLFVMTNPEFH